MVNLSRGMAALGHQVDLVLAKATGPFLDQVSAEVNLVDLGSQRVLQSLPGLVRYLRRSRPDVLLAGIDHANLVALLANKLAGGGSRVFPSVHTPLLLGVRNSPFFLAKWIPFLVRIMYPWADSVIAVSNDVALDLSSVTGLSADRFKIISNPIVTADLLNAAQRPVSHPFFEAGQSPVILGVGRLLPLKGFDVLLRALRVVRKEFPPRMIILGEGPDRARLEALTEQLGLQDVVDLVGYVQDPAAYMAQASVLALPSRFEGFGNVLVEAMACGTPVVATRCSGGPAEILREGEFGPLVPVDDPPALAGAILDVLASPKPAEILIKRANDFSVEKIVTRYLEVLFGSQQ